MRFRSTLTFFLFLSSIPLAHAGTIGDADAVSHVGSTQTVEGVVTGTHVSASGTEFLDFGARYPNQDFTVVIFASSASQFGDISRYYRKKIAVTGKIELYRGRAEIVVRKSNQLQIKP